MKLATTQVDTLLFNGHCKDTRIRKAQILTGDIKDRLVHKVIASRGIFDLDSINIKRYAKAIELKRKGITDKIRVS